MVMKFEVMSSQSPAVSAVHLCYVMTLTSVVNIVCHMQARANVSELPVFLTRNSGVTKYAGSQGYDCMLRSVPELKYSSGLNRVQQTNCEKLLELWSVVLT